jgi:hypothetical protein
MSDTRLADITDALYDQMIAEAYIAEEIAENRLYTFDGPPIGAMPPGSILSVGASPSIDDETVSTTVEWNWGSLGVSGAHADIDEWIRVPCGIHTLNGNSDQMREARRTAIAIYAKAAAFIRGTTLSIPQVLWCIPQPGALTQLQTPQGAEVIISFTANVRTRI